MTVCKNCGTSFEVEPEHLQFLERIAPRFAGRSEPIPPPTFCPDCRLQRKMAHRSWWFVNARTCSKTGKRIFSNHSEECAFPVYSNDIWYSDEWDAADFAVEVSFDRPIFPQLRSLSDPVPRPARTGMNFENSDYSNNSIGVKNCYLTFGAVNAESSLYIDGATNIKDCVDGTMIRFSELCYDCTCCENCYNIQSSSHCHGCHDSFFLFNCRSCHHCFGCANLRHREYCIFNQQYSKEDYERAILSFRLGSHTSRKLLAEKCQSFFQKFPVPHAFLSNTENASGNYIVSSANIRRSFHVSKCENLTYSYGCTTDVKDSYDVCSSTAGELMYECVQCAVNVYGMSFCRACIGGRDLLYCIWCVSCTDCFACVGLKRKQYCIFNKQYSKEEYERLVPRIIEHMRRTGEWGEYFSIADSEYPYNHSVAQLFFPLEAEEAKMMRIPWAEIELVSPSHAASVIAFPDALPESDQPLIVKSELSGRPFRVTSEELACYRRFNVPLPRTTFYERMQKRMLLLGGVQLFQRTSEKSGTPIETTIPPNTPWRVWTAEEYESQFA